MPLRSTKDYSVGILYFILFILTIPAMNWVVMNVGTVCTADGPCLIPVWPGIMAPSGVLMAGVALVLRDGLQAKLGRFTPSLSAQRCPHFFPNRPWSWLP
mgnify:CR=1 FL=1